MSGMEIIDLLYKNAHTGLVTLKQNSNGTANKLLHNSASCSQPSIDMSNFTLEDVFKLNNNTVSVASVEEGANNAWWLVFGLGSAVVGVTAFVVILQQTK